MKLNEGDFYEDNQDLIDERRMVLDSLREEREENRSHNSYWLKCPKCGAAMKEINLSGIMIDKCKNCRGLFFDHGELETLLAIEERRAFFNSMKKVFNN